MSVHVYHAYRQPDGENHCTPLNGRCSHLCLPAPKINDQSPLIACACPDGSVLADDGQNCAADPGQSLSFSNFAVNMNYLGMGCLKQILQAGISIIFEEKRAN